MRVLSEFTGKELWLTDLHADANSVPITYQGKDGKQYVGRCFRASAQKKVDDCKDWVEF